MRTGNWTATGATLDRCGCLTTNRITPMRRTAPAQPAPIHLAVRPRAKLAIPPKFGNDNFSPIACNAAMTSADNDPCFTGAGTGGSIFALDPAELGIAVDGLPAGVAGTKADIVAVFSAANV